MQNRKNARGPPVAAPYFGNHNFVPSQATTGTLARLRDLFARQGIPWVAPISQQDQNLLGNAAHIFDLYLDSETYVVDLAADRELGAMAEILGTFERSQNSRPGFAMGRNARAFAEAAERRVNAAVEAEYAAWVEALHAQGVAQRQAAIDEEVLRDANHYVAFVQGVLDSMDDEDEIDEEEFEAAFASDDEGEGDEGEDEGEGETMEE